MAKQTRRKDQAVVARRKRVKKRIAAESGVPIDSLSWDHGYLLDKKGEVATDTPSTVLPKPGRKAALPEKKVEKARQMSGASTWIGQPGQSQWKCGFCGESGNFPGEVTCYSCRRGTPPASPTRTRGW